MCNFENGKYLLMMESLFSVNALIPFLTLCALELVLGIDNIIFISILAGKLPPTEQKKARTLGLILAIGTRILLLLSLSWIIGLTEPLFKVINHEISGRDLILILGGLFLMAKSTHEIHSKVTGEETIDSHPSPGTKKSKAFFATILQILLLDIVFSLDSVITAVGMVDEISIMIAAVIVSALIMVLSAEKISNFVNHQPTIKMLALSFLLLIGFTLVAEGFEQHISKGYIYFAMGFSLFVEFLNLKLRKR